MSFSFAVIRRLEATEATIAKYGRGPFLIVSESSAGTVLWVRDPSNEKMTHLQVPLGIAKPSFRKGSLVYLPDGQGPYVLADVFENGRQVLLVDPDQRSPSETVPIGEIRRRRS